MPRNDFQIKEKPLFVADGMLGDVARWLRIMGYDTLYFGDADDEELMAKSYKRVLLTSDEQLYHRAKKLGIAAYLVSGMTLLEKLRRIVRKYGLSTKMSGSRCTSCNGALASTAPDKIDSSKVFLPSHTDEIWICENCGKIYWRGSHWKSIGRTLKELEESSM
ncbi:MAG: Mut7-C RNAse domain-containing protein [Thermoproteota archaeon]